MRKLMRARKTYQGYSVSALENVALWHERDISHSSVERVILRTQTILLDYMISKLKTVITGLNVYPKRMLENLEKTSSYMCSQKLMLELVKKGLSRNEAYRITQDLSFRTQGNFEDFKNLFIKIKKSLKGCRLKKLKIA